MSSTQVNGEVPHSATIDHLLRYPVVSDGVNTVTKNKYGQQGIALGSQAYQTLAKPFEPLLAKPYQYLSPYVRKVDELGDKTLSTIEERFPVVTKPTGEVYEDTKSIVLLPYRKSLEGKDHLIKVYSDERKQIPGEGVIPFGKALFVTALVVTSETIAMLKQTVATKKAQVQERVNN